MAHDHLMRAALSLAERGMHVFPLRPGTKLPAVRRDWEGRATLDTDQIERWWTKTPWNIGVATGPSGLVVVDLDAPKASTGGREPHGRQVLNALARAAGAVVPRGTLTVVTAGGGQHLYFRAPDGLALTNTAGRLGPHIDTRARGGYVVGPASRVLGRPYRMVCAADPEPLPEWIVGALSPPTSVVPSAAPRHAAYVRAAVDDETRVVAVAPVGRRNQTLFRAAARLGRFVREGQLSDDDVRSALSAAAERHVGVDGFSHREVRRTIDSGLRRVRGLSPGSYSPG